MTVVRNVEEYLERLQALLSPRMAQVEVEGLIAECRSHLSEKIEDEGALGDPVKIEAVIKEFGPPEKLAQLLNVPTVPYWKDALVPAVIMMVGVFGWLLLPLLDIYHFKLWGQVLPLACLVGFAVACGFRRRLMLGAVIPPFVLLFLAITCQLATGYLPSYEADGTHTMVPRGSVSKQVDLAMREEAAYKDAVAKIQLGTKVFATKDEVGAASFKTSDGGYLMPEEIRYLAENQVVQDRAHPPFILGPHPNFASAAWDWKVLGPDALQRAQQSEDQGRILQSWIPRAASMSLVQLMPYYLRMGALESGVLSGFFATVSIVVWAFGMVWRGLRNWRTGRMMPA